MRTRNPTMSKSSSWPKAKTVVKKWLNLKDSEFHSDCIDESFGGETMRRRKSCSDRDDLSGGWLVEESCDDLRPPPLPRPRYGSPSPAPSSTWRPPKELRMFVGTWNVGGRAPHGGLDLSDWLTDGPDSSSPHIYVLGFQEIVPLNAGNVLGAEDKGPARKWLDLIRRALNHPPASDASSSSSSSSRRHRSPSDMHLLQKGGRVSFSDLLAAASDGRSRPSTASSEPDDDDDAGSEPSTSSSTPESSSEEEPACAAARRHRGGHRYRLAASKQMVGILLCVWVRADLLPCVAGVRASCVGRGVMGYMGNKGSVSVSLSLRGRGGGGAGAGASLCFVCTHLASGDRAGDGARRNGDVAEILRRTRFARRDSPSPCRAASPVTTILEHDKVIWLGDLNYRLLASGAGGTRELVERNEWAALLERDQLRAEQKAGRVFAGWEEGRIGFPPTYKYVAGSDAYAMMSVADSADGSRSRERKKRTPAWCDRILWRGEGMDQRWYARGESRFSDHRPVAALFSACVSGDKPAPAHSSRF